MLNETGQLFLMITKSEIWHNVHLPKGFIYF